MDCRSYTTRLRQLLFRRPSVKSVDSYTPENDPSASQFTVTYRYTVSLPDWAATSEIKNAFPRAARDSQGEDATGTPIKSQNGWQVQNVNAPSQAGD